MNQGSCLSIVAMLCVLAGGCDMSGPRSEYTGRTLTALDIEPTPAAPAAPAPAGRADEPEPAAGHPPYLAGPRRGPAYPDRPWHSLGRDLKELPGEVWSDTRAVGGDPWAWAGFAAAGVTGLALSGGGGNDCVQEHFAGRSNPLGGWDAVGDVGGNPGTHFAIAGAMYAWSLADGNTKRYETSKTLVNALAINGLLTLGLKGLAHTESPNGDENGWPSGHTSSSFCFAAVMHRAYGWEVGVPLYAFASFVGYERLAARNHDFHDVVSGALIGLAIGHAVAGNHEHRIFGMDVVPYVSPTTGASGIALKKEW